MSYQVLARKWRPRTFDELVGQPHVVRALVNALREQRLHHAYLFTGTRGVGKTTIARLLAKCLNCETGITPEPCGRCSACREIDEGRFVDLIEVDAASRTRVEDTRELLENVPYAPTRGRFKVYLVDEVHMLSTHSFNALLKTLEEPPEHVKFLLATTDPQKLPVTVLSRCLQFNLKAMPPEMIAHHLEGVVQREGLSAEAGAVKQLARAAAGSMRDALSLLDQAIGYGGGGLREAEVREMLGAISGEHLAGILRALAAGDARALMDAVAALSAQAPDYAAVLSELVALLHHVAVVQQVPGALESLEADTGLLRELADALDPGTVQLFYQIALVGGRDLPLAPDPRLGLEMVLLRMLAFRPADTEPTSQSRSPDGQAVAAGPAGQGAGRGAPPQTPGPRSESTASATTPPPAAPAADAPATASRDGDAGQGGAQPEDPHGGPLDWDHLAGRLGLTGLAGELARHCALMDRQAGELVLGLDAAHGHLNTERSREKLEAAVRSVLGEAMRVRIQVGETQGETPAARQARHQAERQQAAERAIREDPVVRGVMETFDAELVPGSVRPRQED
ncbi:DNA polymerase III subunit gamma/tau [Ectothiorhodospira mobilis]|uniref:DNA polymerase III subunit gamma/tau n=1 Tax=Ectothiorhodospira mobilis TaxID=195064 RepID=UPI001905D7EF|nr:DNA polymerase III subunit gamma/tau [Ectothiorhodospira mobilis]MBK1690761.1 DNA polymerase III subunit gamma/tau [Ectothiorhodospira mobilis]